MLNQHAMAAPMLAHTDSLPARRNAPALKGVRSKEGCVQCPPPPAWLTLLNLPFSLGDGMKMLCRSRVTGQDDEA